MMKLQEQVANYINSFEWCKCRNPSKRLLKASITLTDATKYGLSNIETRYYCYDCKKLTQIDES